MEAATGIPGLRGVTVLDAMFVAVSVAFFVLSIGYVAACDRLLGSSQRRSADRRMK